MCVQICEQTTPINHITYDTTRAPTIFHTLTICASFDAPSVWAEVVVLKPASVQSQMRAGFCDTSLRILTNQAGDGNEGINTFLIAKQVWFSHDNTVQRLWLHKFVCAWVVLRSCKYYMRASYTLPVSADENALIPVFTGRTVGGTVLLVMHAYIRGDRDREETWMRVCCLSGGYSPFTHLHWWQAVLLYSSSVIMVAWNRNLIRMRSFHSLHLSLLTHTVPAGWSRAQLQHCHLMSPLLKPAPSAKDQVRAKDQERTRDALKYLISWDMAHWTAQVQSNLMNKTNTFTRTPLWRKCTCKKCEGSILPNWRPWALRKRRGGGTGAERAEIKKIKGNQLIVEGTDIRENQDAASMRTHLVV